MSSSLRIRTWQPAWARTCPLPKAERARASSETISGREREHQARRTQPGIRAAGGRDWHSQTYGKAVAFVMPPIKIAAERDREIWLRVPARS